MSRKFKYVGPYDEVEIPAIGAVVQRNHQVEIHDPEVSKGLDGQADWEPVKAAKKTAAKKAEPKTETPADEPSTTEES